MSDNTAQREYIAYRYINELGLVRYYKDLEIEIQNVYDILNHISSHSHECTVDDIYLFIEDIDNASRRVLDKARNYKREYHNVFQSNRHRFCKYANQIVDEVKDLCISLDNFYSFVETMFWRRNREQYKHKKIEYEKQLQNIINYMNNFSANIRTKYNQDCDEFEL